MKAGFNQNHGAWNIKYEFKSKKKPLINPGFQHSRDMRVNNHDTTSDYGTMSNQIDQQNFDDNIPPLNLTNGCRSDTIFGDISIQDRKDRIDSIIREIRAVPKLSEAIITQRNQKSHDKLRKFVSNENLSNRNSVMSGRNTALNSRQSSRAAPESRRSSSRDNTKSKTTLLHSKRPVVPNLNLANLDKTQSYDERSINIPKPPSKSRLMKSISATTLDKSSEQSIHSQSFLPNMGEDTQNELVIIPPTMGDDTIESNSCQTFDITCTNNQNDRSKDFVKENIAASAKTTGRKKEKEKSTYSHVIRPGVVPKYLKDRQQHWRDEAQAIIDNAPDPDCPPGHYKLPDEERTARLSQMKSSQQQLLLELNRMPVSSDTRRVVERKRDLETQLTKLEEDVRVFSRPKVFVPTAEAIEGS